MHIKKNNAEQKKNNAVQKNNAQNKLIIKMIVYFNLIG